MVSPRSSAGETTTVVEAPSTVDKVKKVRNIGPATPQLDESALKALTKGLVGKKKKIKKKNSEKDVSEKKSEKSTSVTGMTTSTDNLMEKSMEKSMDKSMESIESNSEHPPSIEDNTPTVELMSPKSELREAKSRIQELQEEIERLRAVEDEKINSITVVGKLPNKAMTRSASTNSSRANIILRAKKIEKQHAKNTTSKLVIEKQLKKSVTNESSNLSGLLELPGSDDGENTNADEMNKTEPQTEAQNNTITLNSQISQNSLMTDQSEAEHEDDIDVENKNGTVVQEEMTDDDEVISENDEGRGNSNKDSSLENVENLQKIQNDAEISDDELLESGDDEKIVLPQSPQPDVELSS
jgi:hypothetical protein